MSNKSTTTKKKSTSTRRGQGTRNRRKHYFTRGNDYYSSRVDHSSTTDPADFGETTSKWQPRLDRNVYRRVARNFNDFRWTIPDSEGHPGNAKLLRPKPTPKTDEADLLAEQEGMRLVHLAKTFEMFNDARTRHDHEILDCKQPVLMPDKTEKWGTCWKVSVKCDSCSWIGGR